MSHILSTSVYRHKAEVQWFLNLSHEAKKYMKRAFTLIELLVVIAIIAILAAILFPVFAQAKAAAKKTADLSNIKQITTASHIYLSDYDDILPLQAGRTQAGFWNYNSRALVPADWSTLIDER